ncbi:hypothetical protein AB0O01_04660 [Streptomyces sp. NPDC093252]|uniref:hypothetical protein n=1 Tax=Streptomyces sp. NPDC093252 TaxID=3154980 RepID=UPI00341DF80E
MRQCGATSDVPSGRLLLAIIAGQGKVLRADLRPALAPVRCELGAWHACEHACHIWDWPDSHAPPLWARWRTAGPMRFENLTWCGVPGGPRGDACFLYRNHVRTHSWNLRDL